MNIVRAALVAAAILAVATFASGQDAEETKRIEAAIPKKAQVKPLKPRKLLIFELNVGYPGHPSIQTATTAFALMGRRTGAFETVVSRDPAVFARDSLKQFDAVFFNNTVGNCFEDPTLRRNLVEFVMGGGGLMGVHGTSVGFTQWPGAIEDWPEFGCMFGARGASHTDAEEKALLRLEDPDHPVLRAFGGKNFEHADEFFRFGEPYSRKRVRVLLSMDNAASAKLQGKDRIQQFRADDDYAVAWVRNYGRGRVFYSSLAHHQRNFWNPRLLQFYLDGIQFILGDLPAPTIPSERLSPAIRAQEKLGWRLGVEAYTFHRVSFFETIERTAKMGLAYVGGLSFQRVSPDIPKNLDPSLTDEEIEKVRLKLDAEGVRLLTYYIQDIPGDEAECRKVFEFGRKLGIETFMTEPAVTALDTIERFCDEYGINVALHNHDQKASPNYWSPEAILKVCKGRSKRIGAAADVGYWMRGGIDPVAGIRKLGQRLITIQMHDLHEISPQGHDVPWGTGAAPVEKMVLEMHRLKIKPTMFGLEYSLDFDNNLAAVEKTADWFNRLSVRTAGGK